MEHCQPACTAYNDQVCQINNCLSNCNELLFDVGMELREEYGGSLSLVSIEASGAKLMPPPDSDSYRSCAYLGWLLRTHVCITGIDLCKAALPGTASLCAKSNILVALEALPENSRLKTLALDFRTDDNEQTRLMTLLPRIRSLEALSCFNSTDAIVDAVSALLRTTTCLTSLVFHGCFDYGQPPKALFDALTANSTLKSFDLRTEWMADEQPGDLREYVRSNGLITKLCVDDSDADRQELLLDETLVRNSTLCTLRILYACGGERTASFLTRMLAECSGLRNLYIGCVRVRYTNVSEATLTRCAEALVQNQTLEELTLPYSLWSPNNWIGFFALLPRNRHLKKLAVSHEARADYATLPPVLEALAQTNSSTRVSFGDYTHGLGVDLMHFRVFSSVGISGEQSAHVYALQRLPALDHFTSLSLDVSDASERVFCSLAEYIRKTTVLRKLRLTVTSPEHPANNTVTPSCWTLLFESMSANTSVADVDILSNGDFEYNDRLTGTIGHSRYITRVSFLLNTGNGNATGFVSLLSDAIGDNYNLLKVDLNGSEVHAEARRCLFTIMETTRRNSGLLERAAAFKNITRLDR
ncbi:hypothetical protein HPB52_002643 [Rhipicephalus sanguineus]|uniref:Uncharacterized protein n=1 Tax=Rhipicephalus sanguineus TaxID=34632 RepID=A0A9D4PGP8_RHISA|nr:hypothetical protein HPB52_002643 [Rhipicephalus sanguineus]